MKPSRPASVAPDDVHHVGGRRGHLPRTLPHPRFARADAHQDDPRDLLPSRATNDSVASSSSGIDPDLPTPVRHGIALTQLIETYPAEKLPKTGGCSATVVVTMTLEQLLADLDHAGVCTLDTGGRITVGGSAPPRLHRRDHPRRPRREEPALDVGRKRRLHTETMRIAMGVRDGGCTAEGCEAPPGLCHAHHNTQWSKGGRTNVDDGRLLCPHHHRRIHDPQYETRYLAERSASTGGPRHLVATPDASSREHSGQRHTR